MAAKVEEALYSRLSTFAGLVALVATRVYPLKIPPGTLLPAVTFQRIGSTRDKLSGADNTTRAARFEISCWADTLEAARAISEQVVLALDRWSGTEAGVTIDVAFIEDEDDRFEEAVINSQEDLGAPRASVECEVWYEQP